MLQSMLHLISTTGECNNRTEFLATYFTLNGTQTSLASSADASFQIWIWPSAILSAIWITTCFLLIGKNTTLKLIQLEFMIYELVYIACKVYCTLSEMPSKVISRKLTCKYISYTVLF